jgi:hypothetical protein
MVSKHLELTKRQARDHYRRFASPLSRTAPPPSRLEVESSSYRRTTPPPLHMYEVGSSSHHCKKAIEGQSSKDVWTWRK